MDGTKETRAKLPEKCETLVRTGSPPRVGDWPITNASGWTVNMRKDEGWESFKVKEEKKNDNEMQFSVLAQTFRVCRVLLTRDER